MLIIPDQTMNAFAETYGGAVSHAFSVPGWTGYAASTDEKAGTGKVYPPEDLK